MSAGAKRLSLLRAAAEEADRRVTVAKHEHGRLNREWRELTPVHVAPQRETQEQREAKERVRVAREMLRRAEAEAGAAWTAWGDERRRQRPTVPRRSQPSIEAITRDLGATQRASDDRAYQQWRQRHEEGAGS